MTSRAMWSTRISLAEGIDLSRALRRRRLVSRGVHKTRGFHQSRMFKRTRLALMEFRGTPAARAVVFYGRDYGGFRIRLVERACHMETPSFADRKDVRIVGHYFYQWKIVGVAYYRRLSMDCIETFD